MPKVPLPSQSAASMPKVPLPSKDSSRVGFAPALVGAEAAGALAPGGVGAWALVEATRRAITRINADRLLVIMVAVTFGSVLLRRGEWPCWAGWGWLAEVLFVSTVWG